MSAERARSVMAFVVESIIAIAAECIPSGPGLCRFIGVTLYPPKSRVEWKPCGSNSGSDASNWRQPPPSPNHRLNPCPIKPVFLVSSFSGSCESHAGHPHVLLTAARVEWTSSRDDGPVRERATRLQRSAVEIPLHGRRPDTLVSRNRRNE